jgi:hypothetical protein
MNRAILLETLKQTATALAIVSPENPVLSLANSVISEAVKTVPAKVNGKPAPRPTRLDEGAVIADYQSGMIWPDLTEKYHSPYNAINFILRKNGVPKRAPVTRIHPMLATMKAMRDDNKTLEEIGLGHGVSRERVRQILNKAGIPTGYMPYVLTDADMKAVDEYQAGASLEYCATISGVSLATFRNRVLIAAGVSVRKKGRMVSITLIERRETVARLYGEGVPMANIAKQVGMRSLEHVYRDLASSGIKPNRICGQ